MTRSQRYAPARTHQCGYLPLQRLRRRGRRGGGRRTAQSRSRPSPTCAPAAQPGSARKRREHLGDDRRERDRRRFQIVGLRLQELQKLPADLRAAPAPRRRAKRPRPAAGSSRQTRPWSRSATPGLTSTAGERRQLERRREHLADAAHQPRARIEADRHVGAGRARRRVERADRRRRDRWPAREAAAPRPHRSSRRRARRRPAASCRARSAQG